MQGLVFGTCGLGLVVLLALGNMVLKPVVSLELVVDYIGLASALVNVVMIISLVKSYSIVMINVVIIIIVIIIIVIINNSGVVCITLS